MTENLLGKGNTDRENARQPEGQAGRQNTGRQHSGPEEGRERWASGRRRLETSLLASGRDGSGCGCYGIDEPHSRFGSGKCEDRQVLSMRPRIYVDTSVFGGCEDVEFIDHSRRLVAA